MLTIVACGKFSERTLEDSMALTYINTIFLGYKEKNQTSLVFLSWNLHMRTFIQWKLSDIFFFR